jgi:hypothetical protein
MEEKTYANDSQVEYGSDTGKALKIDGEVALVADSSIQRIPIASSDPNDPLNFAQWRKMGILVTTCWFCKSGDQILCCSYAHDMDQQYSRYYQYQD